MFARTEKLYRPKLINVLGSASTSTSNPLNVALLSRPTWIRGLEHRAPSSMRFAVEDRQAILREAHLGKLSITASLSEELWEEGRASFLRDVEKILSERWKPRILIVNELGYPWRKFRSGTKCRQSEFQRKLKKLVNDHQVILIAGDLPGFFGPRLT